MSKLSFGKWIITALALVVPFSVSANEEVRKLTQNPNYWAFPSGNYWNWRYSELNQINNKNASNLVAAWTFSTGRLQGHEGRSEERRVGKEWRARRAADHYKKKKIE